MKATYEINWGANEQATYIWEQFWYQTYGGFINSMILQWMWRAYEQHKFVS